MMTVLNALVGCGLSDTDIFRIFDQEAIGEKYREKGRSKEKWLQKQIDKARTTVSPRAKNQATKDEESGEEKKKKLSMADRLVGLVPPGSLFHADDTAYVDLEIKGHRETWPVKSKSFRDWLAHTAFQNFKKAPASQAMQDALSTICGQALFQGPERQVFVRIGEHKGCIFLDLGRNDWSVVEITPDGWQIIQNPEIRFWRPRGLKPLPRPKPEGNVGLLRDLLNIGSGQDFRLIVGWLLSALRRTGPFPILTFSGEQGTGKSTAGRMLRQLIDPNVADLRTTARSEQDLVIAARNGWIIALDNLSGVKPWLSDALCRIATGGGFGTRELYSDTDEILIEVQRPIIINGIEELCTRGDLADRAVVVELLVIPKEQRRTESDLNRDFESAKPEILGGLLDAIVSGLRHVDDIRLDELPRMADAAVWWTACERDGSLPWPEGGILEAFQGSRDNIIRSYVESDEVAAAVDELLMDSGDFEGTATELLSALNEIRGETKSSKFWPTTPKALSGRIRRAASFMREYGITIETKRSGKNRTRIIYIERENIRKTASAPSAPSAREVLNNDNSDLISGRKMHKGGCKCEKADANGTEADANVRGPSASYIQKNQDVNIETDAADVADANLHTLSIEDDVEVF
jgi:hypothetical protein